MKIKEKVAPPRSKIYTAMDFCIEQFPDRCRQNVDAVQFSNSFGYFVYQDYQFGGPGTEKAGELPEGWVATEIFTTLCLWHGHNEYKSGYVTLLGPQELMEPVIAMEQERAKIEREIVKIIPHIGEFDVKSKR